MNQLANIDSQVTMSSLDFLNNIINPARIDAGENAVRPSDFHARVNDEIDEELNYENFVVGKTGHKTHYAMLNMDQLTLVGMRESKSVRRAVLKKLKQLSPRKEEFSLPGSYIEALEALIESEKQKAIMAPKADVFDKIVDRGVLMTATQVGQKIGMSAVKLNSYLSELGVYNASVKRSRAFKQWFIDKGFGEMKQTDAGYSQALFTNAGEMWVVERFTSEGII